MYLGLRLVMVLWITIVFYFSTTVKGFSPIVRIISLLNTNFLSD